MSFLVTTFFVLYLRPAFAEAVLTLDFAPLLVRLVQIQFLDLGFYGFEIRPLVLLAALRPDAAVVLGKKFTDMIGDIDLIT